MTIHISTRICLFLSAKHTETSHDLRSVANHNLTVFVHFVTIMSVSLALKASARSAYRDVWRASSALFAGDISLISCIPMND